MIPENTPFGLFFAETPVEKSLDPVVEYDDTEQMSFIINDDGQRVPFVTAAWGRWGATTIGTGTKVEQEREDPDPTKAVEMQFLRTQTITEQVETSDADEDDSRKMHYMLL
jgi:hypothetical protein